MLSVVEWKVHSVRLGFKTLRIPSLKTSFRRTVLLKETVLCEVGEVTLYPNSVVFRNCCARKNAIIHPRADQAWLIGEGGVPFA